MWKWNFARRAVFFHASAVGKKNHVGKSTVRLVTNAGESGQPQMKWSTFVLATGVISTVVVTGSIAKESHSEEEKKRQNVTRKASTEVRLRRANTNITSLDSVLMGYEYRLRETASLEKIFKYFSSVVIDGEEFMTPVDLVRAISPGVPPSPNSRPINIPLFEKADELEFSKKEMPDFFRFGEDDCGLISYERFLVIITLLALPEAEVPVAYRMCAGEDFKSERFRSDGLNVHNFDFIMERNMKIRNQGYTADHEPGDLAHFLFGPSLKKTLSLEEFQNFHRNLRDEVEALQYYLLSDKLDSNGEPIMSLPAFARSVAALVPSDYRSEFLVRAQTINSEDVSNLVLEHEKAKKTISADSKFGEVKAHHLTVSFAEFVAWQEVLHSLVQMEDAVMRYSYEDGHFSRTNINRAAKAVAGVKLSRAQIWSIFYLFDPEDKNELHHEKFVRLLKPHSMATNPRNEDEGLGLGNLMSCLTENCKTCVRNWYEGTSE